MPVKDPGIGSEKAYQNRVDKLGAIPEWSLVGRISVDDGERGGSGTLQWNVMLDSSELDFHGAMGRGAWHLQIDPDGAVLKQANGAEHAAAEVNTLIQNHMGWPIPVDALQWWVRGLAVPGAVEDEKFDSEGLLISLDQLGWSIDFSRYGSTAGVALPMKLSARRDNYRVKLAIKRWQLDIGHAFTR